MPYLGFACLCVTGLVFGVSAISKLRGRGAFDEFVTTTRQLLRGLSPGRIVIESTSRLVAVAVVAAEATIPLLLIVPATRRIGLGMAMLCLTAFGAAVAATVRRGVQGSCRCFGRSSIPLGYRHVVRNGMLFAVAATGLGVGPGSLADPAGLALAAGAALIVALLLMRLDDVIELFVPSVSTRRN